MTITAVRPTVPETVPGPVFGPPRLNFAGFCNYCSRRGCTSVKCVRKHAATFWAACPTCHGQGGDDHGTQCEWCLWGVIEVTASWPGAVRGA